MKLQISFDLTNLEKATTVTPSLLDLVDRVEIGTLLLFKHGEQAIVSFREILQEKSLVVDGKIVDQAKETTNLLANAGADWITVMGGTKKSVIHTVCTTAHAMGKKVMINMLDTSSPGQAALEAKSLGGDALILNYEHTEEESLQLGDTWEMVRGNTTLPIFVATPPSSEALAKLIPLSPDGLIISITDNTIDNAADLITSVRSAFQSTNSPQTE